MTPEKHLRIRPSPHSNLGQRQEIQRLQIKNSELANQSFIDPLTGLYNLRYFNQQLENFGKTGDNNLIGVTILMIDLDDLRIINKKGHDFGDTKLKELANVVKETIQATDIFARIGGDEFAIIIPNLIDNNGVQTLLNRLDETLDNKGVHASFSFATAIKNGIEPMDLYKTLKEADTKLMNDIKPLKNQS